MEAIRGRTKSDMALRYFLSHINTVLVGPQGSQRTLADLLSADYYTKTQVDNLVSVNFDPKVVDSLPQASASTMNKVYFLPIQGSTSKEQFVTVRIPVTVISSDGKGFDSELGSYQGLFNVDDIVLFSNATGNDDAYDKCMRAAGPDSIALWESYGVNEGDGVVIDNISSSYNGHILAYSWDNGWIDCGAYSASNEYYVYAWASIGSTGSGYQKPEGGIPLTDLAASVQASLGKANTALQQHQDISGKANVSDLNAHTSNSTIHVTAEDKANWNNKADKSNTYTKAEVDAAIEGTALYPQFHVDTDTMNMVVRYDTDRRFSMRDGNLIYNY